MTQRNIDTMDAIVTKLAEGNKFADALKAVYSKRNVRIPYDEVDLDAKITSLGLSMRITNALLRVKLNTVGDIITFCADKSITSIPTMGKSLGVELFEAVLNYCWDHMSADSKERFLINTVELNSDNIIA